ncbi:phage tail tape measure protein [Sphingobium sp.]|uniref:phage tail tape measure protein n=1 Tax=Sphingobium sp. TaxID=1912891 RepID=UPI003BB6D745
MSDDVRIGGLHGDLSIDVKGWAMGLEDAREGLADFAKEVASQFKELETKIRNIALGLTAAISVPFAGMALVSKRGAGSFEKSMNNVNAALRGISGEQLTALSEAARKLGPEVGRSAKEAADGIETLGLAGMDASAILNGGLAQTLRLAAANAAGLGESAAVVTDVMAQFRKGTGDLEGVVNNITGALDASKLGFNDFKDAIAQGGGVAGSAGVSFEDFNTALAGTAALFGSGSDAGTSFKTFITSLTPKSKEAKEMMKDLGIEFYDATGKMKDLSDIAELLREKLGNLSDRSRTKALTEIFGADAMRTAIGLMRLGGQEFDALQKTIAQTDAGEKLAIQMQGAEEASNHLANAFDGLKIALGATGILAVFTSVTNALTAVTNGIANLNPVVLQIGVAIWGVTAAIGPMMLALMGIVKVLGPMILLRGSFGAVSLAMSALINPLGTVIALLGRFILALSGTSIALRAVGMALGAAAGWIGLAVTALTLFALWMGRTSTASSAATMAVDAATEAYNKQQTAALGLVAATGEARKAIIEKMKADRAAELQAMATARAEVVAAKAELARAQQQTSRESSSSVARFGYLPGANKGPTRQEKEAAATLAARATALDTLAKTVEGYTRSINTPEFATIDMNFDAADAGKKGGKGSGPSAKELADRREQMKLDQQIAVARARDDKDEVRRLEDKQDVLQRQRGYEDAGLDVAAAKLAAERDIQEVKAAAAEFDAREVAKSEDAFDLQLAEIRGDQEMMRVKSDQAYLDERTVHWQNEKLTLMEAQARAAEDLVQLEAARADQAAKAAKQAALDRDVELSRLRSDTGGQQRAKDRAAELNARTAKYYEQGRGKVSEDDARDRADREMTEEDRSRMQGDFRSTFRDGVRAAMDGDLKSFAKDWWKDQVSKGMEAALNNLSDMLFNLFRQALGQGGASGASSGGGIFGSILGGIGSIFGGSKLGGVSAASQSYLDGVSTSLAIPKNLPGFATGGSFEVGGKPGIDTNLVQFWGTAGETVNIRRANDNGGGGGVAHIVPSPYFDVVVDRRAAGVAAPMAVASGMQARGAAGADMKRATRRRIPGR